MVAIGHDLVVGDHDQQIAVPRPVAARREFASVPK